MSSRTIRTIVHFSKAFRLASLEGPQPPGDYRVDHDEALIEGASRLAWRRTASFIHLPAVGARRSTSEMAPINPAELDAALHEDRMTS